MFWRILPHATACVASDKLFVLDVRQDRYFRVPAGPAPEMLAWLNRNYAGVTPKGVLYTLSRARILRAGDPDPINVLRERVSIPSGLMQIDASAIGDGRPFRVALRVASARVALHTLSLNRILTGLRSRSPLPDPDDPRSPLVEAFAFERARRMVPIARNCLLDSLALDHWLASRGIGSQLVFGIAPEPFAAHCWLQTRHSILNDSYDHVSGFTPILAL
ncbi:lasso peptide biosynthesis B2 protein [Sphingomonas sp. G-3-2-10]|uniref:lasso peptide biosynthesis B2 protein n=1 Tax=Sphingomonas sp. G-3-2-10 TaxID=2728838 RepID=UPI00146BEE02|nr:lasso peptide biosynthesis B2 protein [Sphingomonas sp. G-3-2-10]NML08058.1 lasso peptide biosynthesis B2 protein [Sphingomonas sp. G-3-2-10]